MQEPSRAGSPARRPRPATCPARAPRGAWIAFGGRSTALTRFVNGSEDGKGDHVSVTP